MERLTKYAESRPRRAAVIMLALLVVLTVVVAGILVQSLNVGRPFKPPYPSETTPLSLAGDDLKWSPLFDTSFDGWSNYSDYRFHYVNWGGALAGQAGQEQLSSHSEATVLGFVGRTVGSDESYWLNMSVTDSTGDGFFGAGDNVIFMGMPHQNDTVYVVALHYSGGRVMGGWEYSFAIHDGKFYSWASNTLDWNTPWWAT